MKVAPGSRNRIEENEPKAQPLPVIVMPPTNSSGPKRTSSEPIRNCRIGWQDTSMGSGGAGSAKAGKGSADNIPATAKISAQARAVERANAPGNTFNSRGAARSGAGYAGPPRRTARQAAQSSHRPVPPHRQS